MSEELRNQASKLFVEFKKYLTLFRKEIGHKPIIWITDENNQLVLYSGYETYSDQIKEFIRTLGNTGLEIGFLQDEVN